MVGLSAKSDRPMAKTRRELLQQQVEARLDSYVAVAAYRVKFLLSLILK